MFKKFNSFSCINTHTVQKCIISSTHTPSPPDQNDDLWPVLRSALRDTLQRSSCSGSIEQFLQCKAFQVFIVLYCCYSWRDSTSGRLQALTRILKTCASRLSPVLQHLYNLSLGQERIPVLWRTSCLVPVPKKSTPSDLNDYRPVALTSYMMKVLERLVLAHLRLQVGALLDPLQSKHMKQSAEKH